jgi:hypothetical protein
MKLRGNALNITIGGMPVTPAFMVIGFKEKMAIKTYNDIMKMGQELIDDPLINVEMKEIIRQEMENSKLCMEAFGLSDY